MSAELASIFDAFDKETGDGRDYGTTRDLSQAYVSDHPELFTNLERLSIPECVKALEVFRDAGFDYQWKLVQVWLWSEFEPQNIGGTYNVEGVRVNGARV